MMETFASFKEAQAVKALWRYAMEECGGQCVTEPGIRAMPKSCAGNWATQWMKSLPVK